MEGKEARTAAVRARNAVHYAAEGEGNFIHFDSILGGSTSRSSCASDFLQLDIDQASVLGGVGGGGGS